MRFIFLAGGFVGFLIVAVTGLLAGRSNDLVLRDASIGCLAGAFLFRWFWSIYVNAIIHTVKTKRAAQAAAEEAEAAAKATPVTPTSAPARAR
jgi:hypothetical protein